MPPKGIDNTGGGGGFSPNTLNLGNPRVTPRGFPGGGNLGGGYNPRAIPPSNPRFNSSPRGAPRSPKEPFNRNNPNTRKRSEKRNQLKKDGTNDTSLYKHFNNFSHRKNRSIINGSPPSSPIPSPSNTSNPFHSPKPPKVNNLNPYNPAKLPVFNPSNSNDGSNLGDFGQRLLDLLDNNFPRELEPPKTPRENMRAGIWYQVFWTATNWFGQEIRTSFGAVHFTSFGPFAIVRRPGYGYPGGQGIRFQYTNIAGQTVEEGIGIFQTGGIYELSYSVNHVDALQPGTFSIIEIRQFSNDRVVEGAPPVFSPTNPTPVNPLTLQFSSPPSNPRDVLTRLLDKVPNTPSSKPVIEKTLENLSPDELVRLGDEMDELQDLLNDLINGNDKQLDKIDGLREYLKDIQDQLKQDADNEALEDAERSLQKDIQRYDNAQRQLLRESANDAIRQPVNTEPTSLFGEQLRNSVDNFSNNFPTRTPSNNTTNGGQSVNPPNTSINPILNPTVNPINPITNPINPVLNPTPSQLPPPDTNTDRTTRTEITTTINERTNTTPRTNTSTSTPSGCKNTDDPIGKCLGDIESKLDNLDKKNNGSEPETIEGSVQNIKCSKFGENDDSPAKFDYNGKNFKGISSQIGALTKLVTELKKDICRLETTAAIPDYWPPRRNQEIPQLVIHFAEKLANGKAGKTRYTLTIPHYKGGKKPKIESYLKGRYAGCLILKDDSRLIVNAKTPAAAKSLIRTYSSLIDSRLLPDDLSIEPTTRRDKPKEIRVYPVIARYFPKGQKSGEVEWVTYFKF
jgi:hypothetical protein